MSPDPSAISIMMALAAGFTLAACCGLRAFLPALAAAIAVRIGWLTPPVEMAWIASTPSLVALSAAVVLEMAADKIPLLDHALDTAGVVLRPVAGGLVAALPVVSITGWLEEDQRALLMGAGAMAGGGALGLGVHILRAKVRLASTLITGGLANPILSLIDDLMALAGSILALLAPLVAVLLLAAGIALLWRAAAGVFPAPPPDHSGSMR